MPVRIDQAVILFSESLCFFISASIPVHSFIVNTGLLLADMATVISSQGNGGKCSVRVFYVEVGI